ncbi:hypothetical protein, partial [Bradyrhizobium sp. Leaf401]|uniref:hypothetical protein n=1 Tax=Bradyrhizobium sp. Leaf401 TaxID=2876564 RepID=UPI001E37C377
MKNIVLFSFLGVKLSEPLWKRMVNSLICNNKKAPAQAGCVESRANRLGWPPRERGGHFHGI